MKTSKTKTISTTIALVLTTTIAFTLFTLPLASAHTPPWQIPTYAYVVALPETVGVGQTATIYAFLGNAPPSGSAITNTYRFHNYEIIVKAPDGTQTRQFYETIEDTTGAQGYVFTPTQVGTYQITFNYLGQTLTAPRDQAPTSQYVNDTYLPSSDQTTLVVQQDPVPERPLDLNVLPTEYWTRPIYGMNPNWYTVSSNWLGTGSPVSSLVGSGTITGFSSGSSMNRHPGDAIGPETSHIMWTYPIEAGGVVGGNQSYVLGNTWFEGSAYSQRVTNPIIIQGRIFYRPPLSMTGSNSGPTICQDLRTGEIIWSKSADDMPSLSFGYIYDLHSPNQHGTYPAILFSSNFGRAFDAWTGEPLFNVTGVPSGTLAQGPQGEQLRYVITNLGTSANPNYVLAQWNSTKMWSGTTFHPGQSGNSPSIGTSTTTTWAWVNKTVYENNVKTVISENVTTVTNAVNASIFDSSSASNRYDWNVSIPWRNTMSPSPSVLYAMYNNMMILRQGSLPSITGSQDPYTYFAVSLKPENRGTILWTKTHNPPPGNITLSGGPIDPTVGVFTDGYKETTQWVGYSMTTGERLWVTKGQNALDYFGNPIYPYVTGQTAFGKLYSSGLGGVLYCYDLKTGEVLWTYGNGGEGNTTQSYFEVPGNYPIFINAVGSNGLIYLVTTEHTIQTPIYKGAETRCINATTGEEVWALSDYTGEFGAMSYAIADGYATFYNGYDDQMYSVGRGPSATTVTAPDVAAAFGTPVVIKGSVMDVSAGTKQDEQAARFPNGVPVTSDASMKKWMGYIYQQQLFPTDFVGVPVTIDVVDANGNYRNIGSATTDSNGFFHLTWTPDIPGDYYVFATFQGTNGYWPSHSETAFTAMQAPAPVTEPEPKEETPSIADQYFVPMSVGIIIAIAAVGALLAFLLLKKKQ